LYAVIAAVLIAVLLLYFIIKKWFPDFLPGFIPTFFLGLLVQAIQVLAIICIMKSVDVHTHFAQYMFIFLLSSIASVLPLTIGGLGIRELVFLEGSKWFGLLQETSVSISLLFYLLTVIASAIGAYYVFADPLEKNKDPLPGP
jgi:uncharacterized membrane protein YbhN (UPF0104 family)